MDQKTNDTDSNEIIGENDKNVPTSSKESKSVESIKTFPEAEEKVITNANSSVDKESEYKNNPIEGQNKCLEGNECSANNETKTKENPLPCSTSVIDMMMTNSENRVNKNVKQMLASPDKGNKSVALSVGSNVIAKDFQGDWHTAEIVEVDYDEMEVLVRYIINFKRHEEWISINSPRLRPANSEPPIEKMSKNQEKDQVMEIKQEPKQEPKLPVTIKEESKEIKQEEKYKSTFVVGERCSARWRDNRRFMATINDDLGNGQYEIVFDDGFYWKCNVSRLYKWKHNKDCSSTADTSLPTSSPAHMPIQHGAGPSNPPLYNPVFHKHLFDPTRDHLGSKSERREMKRKLNIKEIFNIGQKRPKTKKVVNPMAVAPPKPGPKKVHKVTVKTELKPKTGVKAKDVKQRTVVKLEQKDFDEEIKHFSMKIESKEDEECHAIDSPEHSGAKSDNDLAMEEEVKHFEQPDEVTHVLDRMEQAINRLEDGIYGVEMGDSLKPQVSEIKKNEEPVVSEIPDVKQEILVKNEPEDEDEAEIKEKYTVKTETEPVVKTECDNTTLEMATEQDTKGVIEMDSQVENENIEVIVVNPQKTKKHSKMKKIKEIRLLQNKKVKKQVEKVKSELEAMKRQMEEMRKQMMEKNEMVIKDTQVREMPESFLLPGEWCCKWVNGQPVGTVSEIESEPKKVDGNHIPVLPRRSVQVEDKRLPPGWTKHMVRRSFGHSAGKWDIVLVSPENRRFHTKNDMRIYLGNNTDEALKEYEYALMDFGVHMKLSRRMGWTTCTSEGVAEGPTVTGSALHASSPLIKRLNRNSARRYMKANKFKLKVKRVKPMHKVRPQPPPESIEEENLSESTLSAAENFSNELEYNPPLEDGFVYVGALKVQIIENLLRCPAEACFKNFRNNTLLQMHIKHYHRELRKMLGATPKVADLAYARTMPTDADVAKSGENNHPKVKILKPKRDESKERKDRMEPNSELRIEISPMQSFPNKSMPVGPKPPDSPKLRLALNKPVKRPKVLLPVKRPERTSEVEERFNPITLDSTIEQLDFESAISTHTVTKPVVDKRMKEVMKSFGSTSQKHSEDEDFWYTGNSDVDTSSSFAGSGTPESKTMGIKTQPLITSEYNGEANKETVANTYILNENGERVKIERMKREEIINCHCGFREEDGLMVQCELCLCWQHALCHNIQREADVPEKYTCSICANPRRGRRSRRFVHEQERLYEGALPGGAPCDALRRSHELSGNLHRLHDALHALKLKFHVATKKNHPKLYLWAKDWEHAELAYTQEKLNSDYSDLNIMISSIGKENLPIKGSRADLRTPTNEEHDNDGFLHRDASPSCLLSSPAGGSIDLPISTSELERLAKSVQEAPQPEAAIEDGACRARLLRHVRRCQALVDARLDAIEAHVAELESQDSPFEDDDTPESFPRTKQTIEMLMRDLETMEELAVIT